jgi:predicted phosphate transport protein (TIGR00153 family)
MVKSLHVFGISLLPVGGKKEKAAFKTIKRHATAVAQTVEKFEEAFVAYSEQKFRKGETLAWEVDQLETKADRTRVKFETELGAGAFLPAFRGELARLSERLDDVADMAEDAIRGIRLRPRIFEVLTEAEKKKKGARAIRIGLVELTGKAVNTARALKTAIDTLLKDMDAAAKKAIEVDKFERESDIMEEELLKELYRYEKLICPVTVMQIKDTIEAIGEISNAAEDAGDILSAMVYSFKA